MIVTLNGQPLELTIERERTVGEVLNGIEKWLEESRFSVSGFTLDGSSVPIEKVEEAFSINIDEVQTLDVIASSWRDLFIGALSECARHLEAAAEAREAARKSGCAVDTSAVAESFEAGPASGFLSGNAKDFSEAAAAALRGKMADPDAAIAQALAECSARIEELENPLRGLSRIRGAIPAIADRLESLPLELQTGKDADAALTLRDLANLAEKLLRLIPIAKEAGFDIDERRIGEYDFHDFFEELKTALKELTAGYENGDAILVGDLAEYELAPRLRSLADALPEPSESDH